MKRAVVDQPGLKVIIFGLVISIIIGLSIKSQIAPSKIKARLDQAISRLQPDIKIDFKSVQIKLSDWGWPQPYLEVQEIRVSPVRAICDESQLFIETLSVPLSWNLLFDTDKVVKTLRISQLEIRLSEFKNCFSPTESLSESVLQQGLLQAFSAPNAEKLQELKIDRIKILSKDNFQMPLYLQGAVFEFSYAKQMLSKIALKAQTIFYNDHQKQLFKIKSDLNLNFIKQSPQRVSIDGQLSGKIIDRDYQIQFNYEPEINSFKFRLSANQISIKSIYKFFNFHLDQLPHDQLKDSFKFDLSGFNIFLQAVGFYNLNNNKFQNLQFSDLKIESEGGVIVSSDVLIESLHPLVIQRAQLDVKNFEMTALFNSFIQDGFLKEKIVSGGRFNGTLQLKDQNIFQARGKISEFKFYLRSTKEKWLQNLNQMNFEFVSSDLGQVLSLDDFKINEKPTKGFLKYKTSPGDKDQVQLEVGGGFISAEHLQEIWGSAEPMDFLFKYKKESEKSNVELSSKKMNFYDLKLTDVLLNLKQIEEGAESVIVFKASNINWDKSVTSSESEFVDFYLKQIALKKIEAEGILSGDQYRLNLGPKNKKTQVNLDFTQNQFQIMN